MVTAPDNATAASPTIASAPDDGSVLGLQKPNDYRVSLLETVIFVLMWILALLGNILVVLVIRRSRRMQSTTNYFVISIAFSDLIFVLLPAPFVCVRVMMQEWAAGHVLCRLVRFIQFCSMSSISFILVAICIDRFYTIIYPLSFKVTRGTAKRMILISWIGSIIISCACFYFFDQVPVRNFTNNDQLRYACPTFIPASHWSGVCYALLCVVSQYVCPLALVIVGYLRIVSYIKSIRFQVRQHKRTNNPISRTKIKMVKMLIILSVVTFLLYLPLYTTQIVYTFTYRRYLSADVFISAFWLICASSALKPVIYACGNSNFWRGCKEVLCMSAMRCYRLNTYIVTSASSMSKNNYVGVIDLCQDDLSFRIDSPLEPFSVILREAKNGWSPAGSLPSTSF